MPVIKEKNFKEKVALLQKRGNYLEAFLVQSAYIESILRRLFRYKLTLEVNGNVYEAVLKEGRNIKPIIEFCFSAKWIVKSEYDRVNIYFKKRNEIVHDLIASNAEKSYLRKVLKEGNEIIQDHGSIEKFIDNIQTEHSRTGMVVVKKRVELTEREKSIFQDRISGKSLEATAEKFGITRERVRQIQNRVIQKMEGLVKETVIKAEKLVEVTKKRSIEAETFIAQVCNRQKITLVELKGKSRKADLVLVRHFIAYSLRNHYKLSFPAIGKLLGGRDHTTIMHACSRIAEMLKKKTSNSIGK